MTVQTSLRTALRRPISILLGATVRLRPDGRRLFIR